jgi:hypothetical protein
VRGDGEFLDSVRAAHDHASSHRAEVLGSTICGCFHCCTTFTPAEISEWADEVDGIGQTALCPKCGVDAVIGDRASFELTRGFLESLKLHWF